MPKFPSVRQVWTVPAVVSLSMRNQDQDGSCCLVTVGRGFHGNCTPQEMKFSWNLLATCGGKASKYTCSTKRLVSVILYLVYVYSSDLSIFFECVFCSCFTFSHTTSVFLLYFNIRILCYPSLGI